MLGPQRRGAGGLAARMAAMTRSRCGEDGWAPAERLAATTRRRTRRRTRARSQASLATARTEEKELATVVIYARPQRLGMQGIMRLETGPAAAVTTVWRRALSTGGENVKTEGEGEREGETQEFEVSAQELEMLERHTALNEAVRAGLDKLRREQAALERSATELGKIESLRESGDLITANMHAVKEAFARARSQGAGSVSVSVTKYMDDGSMTDVEIKLDTTKFANVNDQVGSIFKKVRRMERGVAVVEEKLLASMEKQEIVERIAEDLDQCDPSDETAFARIDRAATDHKALDWPPRERQQPLSSRKKAKSFRRYPGLEEGAQIWVGRNRKENEELTLRVGRPGEIWMHARGSPGSHVLVRMLGSLREPSEETLQRAADLTALYSKLKAEAKVPITLADPRQIRKAPRSPVGTVMLLGELGTMIGQPSRVQDLEEVDQDPA